MRYGVLVEGANPDGISNAKDMIKSVDWVYMKLRAGLER